MEKSKILEIAQMEKNKGQEYETKVLYQSTISAIIVAVLISVALFLMEIFVKGTVNLGLIVVGLIFLCIQMLVEGTILKKKRFMIGGILLSFVTLFLLVSHIVQVVS